MDKVKICRICRSTILAGEPFRFVKPKGKPIQHYCEKCMKGELKNDTSGKRP